MRHALPMGRHEQTTEAGTNLPRNLPRNLRGKPFQNGYDSRRNMTKGGRPTDEFLAAMRALASSEEVLSALSAILSDKDHPGFIKAFTYCADRGYGRPTQSIEVTSQGASIAEILRKGRDRVARMKAEAEGTVLVDATDRLA